MTDDASTLAPPEASNHADDSGLLALTIAYHPDVERVGERHLVRSSTEISRATPAFSPTTGGLPRPLLDRYVSRSPLCRLDCEGTHVVLEPGAGILIVDGRPIERSVRLDFDAVSRGVTIELADRVALVLHFAPRETVRERYGLVGESGAIERVRADIARVLDLEIPLLIRGETGTGKELIARAVHESGPRGKGPFVAVNLAVLPPTMAASELFGHSRGAFTGATQEREGLFHRAAGGTLFLDEIGEAPVDVQPMLLRALETGEVEPLGGNRSHRVDVRVIAATDADLELQIEEGGFREALFHRLAGYQLHVPPLCARVDDIGRLMVHFLRAELRATGDHEQLALQADRATPWLPLSIVSRFLRYSWPGNVRQLRNAVRQLAIASRGAKRAVTDPVLERLLATPTKTGIPTAPVPPRREPNAIRDDELLAALRASNWRAAAAAHRLGVSRSTLYNLIDRSACIRKAKDIPEAELREVLDANGGDVDQTAITLEVSRRALQLRLTELGWS